MLDGASEFRKLPSTRASPARRFSTSAFSRPSPWQASTRNSERRSGGCPSAASKISLARCHFALIRFSAILRHRATIVLGGDLLVHLLVKPRPRHFPITLYGTQRNSKDLSGFFLAKAAEKSQFHDSRLTGVALGQPIQRLVEGKEVLGRVRLDQNRLINAHLLL